MMAELTPRERQRLRQANRVADLGKRTAAEKLYRELLDESPHLADAWLGLARTTREEAARAEALTRVLTLEPDNAIAHAALAGADLDELLAPEPEPVVPPEIAQELPAEVAAATAAPVAAQPLPVAPVVPPPAAAEHTHVSDGATLRCNKCGKPIGPSEAVRTPVGYRCKECVRELENALYSATPVDYVIATVVAFPLALIAAALILFVIGGMAGFFGFIITLFVSPTVGTFIATLAFRLIGRRRGRYLPQLMAGVIWVAALAWLGITFLLTGSIGSLLLLGIFAFSASGAAYWRVR